MARRFHHFLNEAEPQIPIGGRGSDPLIVTFDKQAARDAMRPYVAGAADDVMVSRRLGILSKAPLDFVFRRGPPMRPLERRLADLQPYAVHTPTEDPLDGFYWMCDEFCRFLDEGVRTGDGTWPPSS